MNSQLTSPLDITISSSPKSPAEPYKQINKDGKKSFQCLTPGCAKIFRYKSDMERHLLIHTKEKSIVCPYPSCNKSFKRPDALKNHMKTMHIENTVYRCTMPGCDYQFPTQASLRFHILKHQVIQQCATLSSDGEKIAFPWKRVLQWQKNWWNKYKATQDGASGLSMKDFENEFDFLEMLRKGGNSEPDNFWNNENFSCCSKDIADAFSVASFTPDELSNAQDFFDNICDQLAKENHELKKSLKEKDLVDGDENQESVSKKLKTSEFDFHQDEKPELDSGDFINYQNVISGNIEF